ncbi:sensor histidine kinase [Jeotgalibaca ciconiae]|uniref:histidine kinase n=1 Tax=Jeotgalibaca ciconiae TaxID=2496265 RepID=A0A3Q9BKB7_9LACT|nr:ATP-binding protein [Jeotgalibaca ciconiae]AZP04358.1 two-component sensor histidine kinase [Jeotgalibaca ciconiae]
MLLKTRLTKKELGELIFEAIVTMGIMYFIYMGLVLIFNRVVQSPPDFLLNWNTLWELILFFDIALLRYRRFILITATIFAMLFTWWRLFRRYKQMQLRHVLDELHYVASGNFEHRIKANLSGNMNDVVHSINTLVESTVMAMEEERKIEQSKDELITNVSHDIRTPLTSIIGYLGLIEEGQYSSKEDLERYIHIAYTKSLQMKVLVDDLFEYTKVRQTSTPLTVKTVSLGNLLEQIAAEFELESTRKEMNIEVEMKTTPLMIEFDVDKMARVFNNLISNALKYGKDGNLIRIVAEKVGSEAIISVINNGKKIPQESLDELFNRFYRVEASRSQQTGGTGLGLAIAQSIISLHGGYIYAESNDQETKFVMHLPLKQTNT